MKPLTFLLLGLQLSIAVAAPAAPSGQVQAWDGHWAQARTASVRVYHEVGHPLPLGRLRELEAAVQRLATELGLPPERLDALRQRPIDYLYVRDASQLRWFGVDAVDGLALVAERKILASRLPHEHELVHVLAHLAIEPALPDNQPWLQEGLASYLGGHLGEAPAAVLAAGDQVLDEQPGLISALLTVEGFRGATMRAASAYAASARFVQYLDLARGGRRPLLELLRLLSGVEGEIAQRPASIIETQLEGVYSTSFERLLEDFEAWRAQHPPSGIVNAPPPRRPADLRLVDEDHELHWWIEEAGWVLAAIPRHHDVDLAISWGSAPPLDAETRLRPERDRAPGARCRDRAQCRCRQEPDHACCGGKLVLAPVPAQQHFRAVLGEQPAALLVQPQFVPRRARRRGPAGVERRRGGGPVPAAGPRRCDISDARPVRTTRRRTRP